MNLRRILARLMYATLSIGLVMMGWVFSGVKTPSLITTARADVFNGLTTTHNGQPACDCTKQFTDCGCVSGGS
jgi:hypothetical protein